MKVSVRGTLRNYVDTHGVTIVISESKNWTLILQELMYLGV